MSWHSGGPRRADRSLSAKSGVISDADRVKIFSRTNLAYRFLVRLLFLLSRPPFLSLGFLC